MTLCTRPKKYIGREEEEDCETHLGDMGGTENGTTGDRRGSCQWGKEGNKEKWNFGDSIELGFDCLGVDFDRV